MSELDATLLGRRELAPGLAFFDVELERPLSGGEAGRAFKPGQYVTVGLPGPNGAIVRRPLTITSTPSDPRRIELLLNRVATPASEVPLSHLLFDLPVGRRLSVRPVATGTFTLEDTVGADGAELLLVGSGTGIAPFLAMIRDRRERGVPMSGWRLLQISASGSTVIADRELEIAMGSRRSVLPDDARAALDDPERIESLTGAVLRPGVTTVLACGLGEDLRALSCGLLHRGYVPRHRRLRAALEVAPEHPVALFMEQYDSERLYDTKDAALMTSLKARLPPP